MTILWHDQFTISCFIVLKLLEFKPNMFVRKTKQFHWSVSVKLAAAAMIIYIGWIFAILTQVFRIIISWLYVISCNFDIIRGSCSFDIIRVHGINWRSRNITQQQHFFNYNLLIVVSTHLKKNFEANSQEKMFVCFKSNGTNVGLSKTVFKSPKIT